MPGAKNRSTKGHHERRHERFVGLSSYQFMFIPFQRVNIQGERDIAKEREIQRKGGRKRSRKRKRGRERELEREGERKRIRDRDREKERERQRKRGREIDKEIEEKRERDRDRERERERERQREVCFDLRPPWAAGLAR